MNIVEKLKSAYRAIVPLAIRKPLNDYRKEREFHYDAEIEFYGAYWVLKRHLRIKKLSYAMRKNLNWAHGWYSDFFMTNAKYPYMATCNNNYKEIGRFNFVTRKTQEDFLKMHGYSNVKSIGMPIIYIPQKKIRQVQNSLLVMPGHSLESNKLTTFEEEYVELINSFRKEFKKITVCIHPACFINNHWVGTFKKNGYKIIKGVKINDKKAFYKLQNMMSQFEYMTTNACGSHIMYASYFGSKVSIIGKEPVFKLEDLYNVDSWRNEPDKSPIEESFNIVHLANYKIHYPSLFVDHPVNAILHKELADYELGVNNKITKQEFDEIASQYSI